MRFKDFILKEEKESHAVLAFGRLNPPTTGHQVLVNKVHEIAKQHKATHHVVVSSSQDKAKNPLSSAQKLKHAQRFFPKTNVSVATKEHPNFLKQAEKLHKKGATHLHMVAGSDRVDEYHKLLHKYNGTHKGALFNFKHIKVHSAGQRDPDAEGATGMSASKMRAHAASGNYNEFKKGIPSHVRDHHAKELYHEVRKGMNVKEQFKLEIPLDILFEEVLNEGVHDKGIFKAVFLAGGPGSGKDYVLSNTLDGHGLTEINSDKALEYLMDKEKLDKRMPESEKQEREFVRGRAKNMTEVKERLALQGRNGLIINGTGDDAKKIARIKEKLESLGYETSMITVNTDDEVSKQRNIERGQRGGRTVPEDIRKEKWDSVQKSRPELAKLFGDKYIEFDNSEDLRKASPEVVKQKQDEMLSIFKQIKGFVSKPPENELAKKWISSELGKKDILGVSKDGVDKKPPQKSRAYQEAMKLGLQYMGFGRYGKQGKVSHHSVNDQLVADVNEEFDAMLSEEVKISITADTPEEAVKAIKLLTSDSDEDEVYDDYLSSQDAKDLLTLGAGFSVIEPQVSAGSVNIMPKMNAEEVKVKYLSDKAGKPRVFILRAAAAKEAHVINGSLVKTKQGYLVKLKESVENLPLINEQFVTEIDAGTEIGMSLSGHNKEHLGKDGKITAIKKKGLKELTGDTTTASIGAQKEDELRKQGISLSSFRSKNPI
jgi:predicted ABC-type ATPase/nicotinamide mononucleotide adenylyltransferase